MATHSTNFTVLCFHIAWELGGWSQYRVRDLSGYVSLYGCVSLVIYEYPGGLQRIEKGEKQSTFTPSTDEQERQKRQQEAEAQRQKQQL